VQASEFEPGRRDSRGDLSDRLAVIARDPAAVGTGIDVDEDADRRAGPLVDVIRVLDEHRDASLAFLGKSDDTPHGRAAYGKGQQDVVKGERPGQW
jgi:hypothetical protein